MHALTARAADRSKLRWTGACSFVASRKATRIQLTTRVFFQVLKVGQRPHGNGGRLGEPCRSQTLRKAAKH